MALKRAGADGVKVFAVEGEGGLTPGAQPRDAQLRLGPRPLDNLVFLLDWNDYGIDEQRASRPSSTARPRLVRALRLARASAPSRARNGPDVTQRRARGRARRQPGASVPTMAWFKTRKGRGYGKYDYKSHGTPRR